MCTKSISRKAPSSSTALDIWYQRPSASPARESACIFCHSERGSCLAESGMESSWKCDSFLTKLQTVFPVPSASRVLSCCQPPDLLGVKLVGSWFSRVPPAGTLLSELGQPLLIRVFSCLPIFIVAFSFLLALSSGVYSLKHPSGGFLGGNRGTCVCPSCHFKQAGLWAGSPLIYSPEPQRARAPGFSGDSADGTLGGCSVTTAPPRPPPGVAHFSVWPEHWARNRGKGTNPSSDSYLLFSLAHLQFQDNHHQPVHFQGSKRDQVG